MPKQRPKPLDAAEIIVDDLLRRASKSVETHGSLPDGCVSIPLTKNKVAVIDAADAAFVNQWVWGYDPKNGYARRNAVLADGRRRTVYLHRAIMRAKTQDYVDHKNGDKLDCRRENLRHATVAQNNRNVGLRRTSKSGKIGVNWTMARQQWRAYVNMNGKQIFAGYYDTVEEAAAARDKKAAELHGEFARLNSETAHD